MEDTSQLTPAQRAKLLEELKHRLQEIQSLRHELGMDAPAQPARPEEKERDVSSAIEELKVPPLELLDDTPIRKKKKELA